MFCAVYKFDSGEKRRFDSDGTKRWEDEGVSDGPLDKPSLLSLQNTAIKVRRGLPKLK